MVESGREEHNREANGTKRRTRCELVVRYYSRAMKRTSALILQCVALLLFLLHHEAQYISNPLLLFLLFY